MKLEDFEKTSGERLRAWAVECFDEATSVDQLVSTILYRKARFFLDEIDRRADRKIARRDFRMELIVIFLIGLELVTAVGLAFWGGREQSREVQKQRDALGIVSGILSNLQDSSKATADTMRQLKSVTDTMNGALQKQVELFYDVQVNVVYNPQTKKLTLINGGRSNVTVWAQRVGEATEKMQDYPKSTNIPPAGTYEIALENQAAQLAKILPKDQAHQFIFKFLLKNERQERFTISGDLIANWHDDTVIFSIPFTSILAGWDRN